MLVSVEDCIANLRCPVSKRPLEKIGDRLLSVPANGDARREYRIIDGRPVLVDFETSVLEESTVETTAAASEVERANYSGMSQLIKKMLSPDKDGTRKHIEKLREQLATSEGKSRVLVIGGGSIGQGMQPLYDDPQTQIYSFDIYATPNVQFVADAHAIPIEDGFFDAVVIQAVLEHVLEPEKVVSEIWRVLRPGGIVYADTPFMQQVHEGAYDFTRFTESGHRYLFRRFDLIESGSNGGPGLQLMWSADYFVRSLFRSRIAGKIAKLAFVWAQLLDRFIPEEYAVDGASGVYFLGRKTDRTISPQEIIEHYGGAQ